MNVSLFLIILCISLPGIFSINYVYPEEYKFQDFWFEKLIMWETEGKIPEKQFINSLHWMQINGIFSKNDIKNMFNLYLNQLSEPKIPLDDSCITFDAKTITVTCPYARFTEVNDVINDDNILKQESDGVWLLNANLTIRDDSTFFIDPSDTTWLKLNSDKNYVSNLKTYGNLLIDSVKITSWNSTVNDYAKTDGDTPRSSIQAAFGGTGVLDVTNSEIAYLGYHKGGLNGMAYMKGGHNSLVKGNDIHHMWYGFYSNGVGGIVVENNNFHDNNLYGIDPHTATHDMIIRNNIVRNTNGNAIICSLDCYNITIENNKLENNLSGIVLHRNTTDSIVRNNIVYNSSLIGIDINESTRNKVYNNTINNSTVGIAIHFNVPRIIPDIGKGFTASNNIVYDNFISNSNLDGILVNDGASDNTIKRNIIKNTQENAIHVKDLDSLNNLFVENKIIIANQAINIENNTSSIFLRNNIEDDTVYTDFPIDDSCITYYALLNRITIACPYARLTEVNSVINNDDILKQESDGVWLLKAHLIIENNSTFFIDSTDTTWLKLNSNESNFSSLKTYGNLLIDSVKITSWDSKINDYAITDGDTPRSSIQAAFGGTGVLDVTNSEIAYLGYHKGGLNGMAYMNGGHNSLIKGNDIHHMWYGFYSNGVGGLVLENNNFHDNNLYGIDPHSSTHDMIIRNNIVRNTNEIGIVCSLDCYNILIENNQIYNNRISVFFSRNMTDSIVRNNTIYDSDTGIEFSASSNNQVYNNTIFNTKVGISVKMAQTPNEKDIGKGYVTNNNLIDNNLIFNSTYAGILVRNGPSNNTISHNIIQNSNGIGIYVQDLNTLKNIFLENKISNVFNPIKIENNIESIFINNTISQLE